MSCWNKEIASLFALFGSDVAVCCEFEVTTWELVLWILVNIKLLVLLSCFKLIALKKHFNLETQILFVRICSYSQEIEAMLFIDGVLHVVKVSLMNLEELVVFRIIGKLDCLLKLSSENLFAYLKGFCSLGKCSDNIVGSGGLDCRLVLSSICCIGPSSDYLS